VTSSADGFIPFPDCPGDDHHGHNEAVALSESNRADVMRFRKRLVKKRLWPEFAI
jgi:hypothetical protein